MAPPRGINSVVNAAYYIGEMVPPRGINSVVNAAYYIGEMAEWSNAAVSKTVVLQSQDRGFESPSLRNDKLLPYASRRTGFLFYRWLSHACMSEDRWKIKALASETSKGVI
jgi:hypothetical protein